MRADEPISIFELEDVDYINQLRVERLMRGAKAIRNHSYIDSDTKKDFKDFVKQCERIALALEARAKRIKEGMYGE